MFLMRRNAAVGGARGMGEHKARHYGAQNHQLLQNFTNFGENINENENFSYRQAVITTLYWYRHVRNYAARSTAGAAQADTHP
jgi:hypothetical protein